MFAFNRAFLICSGITLCSLFLSGGENVLAADVTVPMSASIQSELELGVEIRQIKDGTVISYGASQIAFGLLKSDTVNGPMRGEYYYDVYLHPNSSQRPYRLTQAGTVLSNGATTLPTGACVVTPWPRDKNGNAYPAGASVGTVGSFVTSRKVLYESGPSGLYAPVAMTYAITSDSRLGSTQIVPADQAGGNYFSSITFQIELAS